MFAKTYGISPRLSDVTRVDMNADESLISLTDGDLVERVLESKSKDRPIIAPSKIEQHAIFLMVVNFLGDT